MKGKLSSSLVTKGKNTARRKKVSWKRNQIVEVIYECYIPLRIRCSSSQLHNFTKIFNDDAEQYLKGVMQRKNLSRISPPTNEHGSKESKLFATVATAKGYKRE